MPIGITKGTNWQYAESKSLKSNLATAFSNNLNWGRLANEASLTALTTDVITSIPNVGDYAVFASTAPNVPSANLWYISCVAGGSSAIGGRYMAYRTGGAVSFGYITTAGTITWKTFTLT
jgi:hypothetical protein